MGRAEAALTPASVAEDVAMRSMKINVQMSSIVWINERIPNYLEERPSS